MELTKYIKDCLRDSEFKKYWLEDNLPLIESETVDSQKELSMEEAIQELFESEEEYEQNLDSLLKDKGIKGPAVKMSVEFYEKDSKCPVADFLNSITDKKLKQKTVKNIYNLSILGLDINKTDNSSYVDDGIYELRTKQGNNIDRIFYFFVVGNKIILTNGYIKKSQKLDQSEFKKAKAYMKEYSTRN